MTKENSLKILELQLQAEKIRKRVVEMIFSSKSGHIGGSLSSVDINTTLYFHIMNIDPENALKNELDTLKKAKIRKEIIAASQDPLFLADIAEIEEDFKYSDFE